MEILKNYEELLEQMIVPIIFIGSLSFVIILNVIKKMIFKEKSYNLKSSRRKGQLSDFTTSRFKEDLNEYISRNVRYEKRYKYNDLLMQSGTGLTMADLLILSVMSSLGTGIILAVPFKNSMLFLVGLILGVMAPKQIITVIRNRRITKFNTQVTSFIRMTVKRYYVTGQLSTSIELSAEDFEGKEPMISEINKAISEMEVGGSAIEALENMERRTQNQYLKIFTSNLRAATNIGTESMKQKLLDAVIDKFDEDVKINSELKRELNEPVFQGLLMMLIVPATFVINAMSNEEYLSFMINKTIGKMAIAASAALLGVSAWVIINKIGAPLEKDED